MNYIHIDGKKIPLSDETADRLRKELTDDIKTIEHCYEKVIDEHGCFISTRNTIHRLNSKPYKFDYNELPTKRHARMVQIYMQLLVVAEALNDGQKGNWVVYMSSYNKLSTGVCWDEFAVFYKDGETAEKAIEIAGHLYHEYFKLLNND